MAKFCNGSRAEKDIDLTIVVLDENDCTPVIQVQQVGYVNESSAAGILRHLQIICVMSSFLAVFNELMYYFILLWFLDTFVMKVIATDDDEEGSLFSQIAYSVEQSTTAGMFYIKSQTGEVMVRRNTLDREVRPFIDLKFLYFCLAQLILFIGKAFNSCE